MANLCESCRWVRVVTSRRGSTFFRCGRAELDAAFERYPRLPVSTCSGYEPQRAGDDDPASPTEPTPPRRS